MCDQSYSEYYNRLKKDGVKPALIFFPQNQSQEEFRPITDSAIPNILPIYLISNFGNVYDISKQMFVTTRLDKDGYEMVSLRRNNLPVKTIAVHRLELLVFNYNINYQALQVNHIDGNPSNNNISNLEWCTAKENSDHAMLYGLHVMNGTNNPNNKLTEQQVHEICKLIESGNYYDTEIADMYNVSYANISDIHKGKIWTTISKNYDLSNRKPRKLTEQQVHEICKLLESKKYYTTEIAKMYNISHETVCDIRNGNIWQSVSKFYNINEKKPRKFTDEQVREICEVIVQGKYLDSEIAKMFGTTNSFLLSLRKGSIRKNITKDFDMTIRKR